MEAHGAWELLITGLATTLIVSLTGLMELVHLQVGLEAQLLVVSESHEPPNTKNDKHNCNDNEDNSDERYNSHNSDRDIYVLHNRGETNGTGTRIGNNETNSRFITVQTMAMIAGTLIKAMTIEMLFWML